jgi:hypothetical protein
MEAPDRETWSRALMTGGWLLFVGYIAELAVQFDRARQITTSSFGDGVWGQRIEIVSFAMLPQQLIVLVPAAAAAIGAAMLAKGTVMAVEPWLDRLVVAVAGAAVLAIGLGLVGIIASVAGSDDAGDFGNVVRRVGGITMAIAIVRVSLMADRFRRPAPGDDGQAPRSPSR